MTGTAPRGEVALASSGPASSAPAAVDLAPDKAQSLSFLVAGALLFPLHLSWCRPPAAFAAAAVCLLRSPCAHVLLAPLC